RARSLASASSRASSASSSVLGRVLFASVISVHLSTGHGGLAPSHASTRPSRRLNASLDHHRGDPIRIDGLAQVTALAIQAVVPHQKSLLLLRFDAYGHCIDRKPACDGEDNAAENLGLDV